MKLFTAAIAFSFVAGAAFAAAAKSVKPPSNEDCLTCHGEADAKRANGRSVFVSKPKFDGSVHGEAGLACVDCHTDLARATDFPHAEKLAPPRCANCHREAVAQYGKSVHSESRRQNGGSLAATCTGCHGTHDILSSQNPSSPTYALNLPSTCARCHGNPDVIRKGHIAIGNVAALYEDSIHGQAVLKSGLVTAPTCKTCHGMHDIRRASDPEAGVSRGNVTAKCGSCHRGIQQKYDQGIHGTLFRSGDKRAPVCTDCHTAHHIRSVELETTRLDVLKECGTCHKESRESFRDTYHGQVTNLGFARIATCSDCHRAHDIFRASDARSSVSASGRVATCQRCHPGTNEKFARYDPHPNPKNRRRDPLLFYAAIFMKWLLVSVMAFFGLHTILWFPRSWRARKEGDRQKLRIEGGEKK